MAAAASVGPPARADANLLPNGSFESGLAGWAALSSSSLSLAADGVVGPSAARAALSAGSTSTSFGLIVSPPVVASTTAGASYQAGGWFRSDTPGRQLCLRVRERLADGTYVYGSSCVVTSTSWQSFPLVSYTTAAAGDRLDLYVSEYGAKAGDSFEVDGLSLGPDTTPPETTISAAPASYSSTADASFVFASSEAGSTFTCTLDGGTPAPCVSPAAYSGLADGQHTFTVAASDAAGNVDPTPASVTWTIDTVGRLLRNGSFEGSLVGWTGTSSTLSLASDGVVGTQAAKVSSTGTSSFGLIASPPAVASSTAGRILDAGARVRSDTPGHQLCLRVREQLVDGSYLYGSSCVTSTTSWQTVPTVAYTPTADGDRLDVYVSEYGAAAGDSFEVDGIWLGPDTTPPETTITSAPQAYTSDTGASFAFASSEAGSSFLCGLDSAPLAPCTSPQAYTGLPDGAHSFRVAAVDPAGNVDPTPAIAQWTIDTFGGILANGSFEGSTVGWNGFNATLGIAADGVVGTGAATATLAAGTTATSFGLIASPSAIASVGGGRVYEADAWVRSVRIGMQICLKVRERRADGSYLYGTSCVPAQAGWQQLPPVRYTTAADGDRLDVYLTAYGASAGDSFEADGVYLRRVPAPPATTSPPTLTGTASDGQTLTVSPGSWAGTQPIALAYAWKLCDATGGACTDTGAAGTSFTLDATMVGHTVEAIVTATNIDGSASAIAGPSRPVQPDPPVVTSPPALTGTASDGQTLTVTPGSWTGTQPIAVGIDWRLCDATGGSCTDTGVTGTSFPLDATMIGRTAEAVVTATNPGGSTSAIAGPTAPVQAAPPTVTAAPVLTGTARDGETLTVTPGSWSGTQPIALGYAWKLCDATGASCADTGDTGTSYTLDATAIGHTVEAVVTATNAGGSTGAVAGPTPPVQAVPPSATTAPSLTGTPSDGGTLTVDPGSWTGSEPIALVYAWKLCDAAGGACTDTGAAGTSFTLDATAVGHTVEVVVTATNAGGTATALAGPSAPVQAVPPAATASPAIAGTAQIGSTLTGSTGGWTGTQPLAVALQWRRCAADGTGCADIAGATSSSYTPTIDDLGHALVLVATATNVGGTASAASAATAAIADTPQPSFPIRAAFYYPWYPAAWKQAGLDPFTHYHPTLGFYDSSDLAHVVGPHIAAMQYAHIQVGISSWWGVGDDTDQNFAGLLRAAAGTSFRWAIYYEPEGQGNPSPDQIRADLLYIKSHYASDPSYLRIGGRFVVFAFDGGPSDTSDGCAMPDRWKQANTVGAYVVLKVFTGYHNCTSQPDSWHQYAPAVAESSQVGFSFTISPGFWLASSATPSLTRDPTRWNQNIRDMVASNAPWQLITTFNEWGEGTAVESAAEWATSSGFGVYLDALNSNGLVNGTLPPASTAPPTITASPNTQPGATLTASNGSWSNSPTGYLYRWRRCDSTGNSCSDIAGATAATYVPTSDDLGSTLRVVVTATNAGGSTSATAIQTSIVVPSTLPDTSTACTGAAPPAAWTHVIWIWMENKAYAQVVGAPTAPFVSRLAATCGVATAYHAVAHPSLPNYIAATSGSTQGITDDLPPPYHPLAVPSIYSQLTAAGLTWREYEEAAPTSCPQIASGNYAVRHDPAAYYTTIRTDCAVDDIPAGTLAGGALLSDLAAGTLPTFAFVTPDVCNDMHQCPVQAGDDWLRAWLPLILSSPAYAAGTTAVFIVWDENDGSSGNLVPLLAVSPSTPPGTQVGAAATHYSLLRTTEELLGLGLLGNAATATSLRQPFGLGGG